MSSGNETIEEVLAYIGITKDNVRTDAYNHWKRYVEFVKENSGKNWKEEIRPKLRSWIGVDFRYIDDYHKTCNAWGIHREINGALIYLGIPDANKLEFVRQQILKAEFERVQKVRKEVGLETSETFEEYAQRKQQEQPATLTEWAKRKREKEKQKEVNQKQEDGQHPRGNCGQIIPNNLNFCSETCAKEYAEKEKRCDG